jgi:hypothetical protein
MKNKANPIKVDIIKGFVNIFLIIFDIDTLPPFFIVSMRATTVSDICNVVAIHITANAKCSLPSKDNIIG